jgi:hypothetical protein
MWYLQVYDIAIDEVYQVRISDRTKTSTDLPPGECSVSSTPFPGVPLRSQLRSEWGLPESEWTPVE